MKFYFLRTPMMKFIISFQDRVEHGFYPDVLSDELLEDITNHTYEVEI